MTAESAARGRATGLMNRLSERGVLDRLVEAVRAGESRALVMSGDPGMGKTVLLDYLAGQAAGAGCRVARAVGVQSEMELAFAGLHQLCGPMLGRAERLPVPQHDALRTAFGIAAGPPPDRFLVGLAVLSLLSEVAGGRPLICLIDDEQWLDRASAQALAFTARRLGADPVGLVFAAREPDPGLAGLPELEVGGLGDKDARALLDAALPGPLDARVRDLIVAETCGNPLALLELPRGLTPMELAGGFGLPGAGPLPGRIEDSFARQLEALPADTRRLVQLAAADPSGDRSLVLRAATRLGVPADAADPAERAALVKFSGGRDQRSAAPHAPGTPRPRPARRGPGPGPPTAPAPPPPPHPARPRPAPGARPADLDPRSDRSPPPAPRAAAAARRTWRTGRPPSAPADAGTRPGRR